MPRATTKFHYKTKIVSENFKGSSSNSSAEYINAALVQAPINGGSHKFDDDVWLQKAVTGTNTIFCTEENRFYYCIGFRSKYYKLPIKQQ